MRPIEKRASLVALVGLDGAGKTTQSARLEQYLRSMGHKAIVFQNESLQPAKQALDAISHRWGFPDHLELLSPSRAYLMTALFKWHSMLSAVDLIETGDQFVIMDRYACCYVAAGHGSDPSHVSLVRDAFSIFPPPDLTLYLDLPPADAAQRLETRGAGLTPIDLMQHSARGYRALPEFEEFAVVDGTQGVDQVADEIRDIVSSTFQSVGNVSSAHGMAPD